MTNTMHTAALAALVALSLGTVACDGGSASMTVEDGVVTETHALTADDLTSVEVSIRYPEARLLAGEVQHVEVRLVPRLQSPETRIVPRNLPEADIYRPVNWQSGIDARAAAQPTPHVDTGTVERPTARVQGHTVDLRTDRAAPRLTKVRHAEPTVRVPDWMQVTLRGEGSDAYRAELVYPVDGLDDRIDPEVLGRN